MYHLIFNFQKAIYQALEEDEALSNRVSGIYTHVPQESAFPYLTIGNAATEDRSTLMTSIAAITLDIHIFSREKTVGEMAVILADISRLLHRQVLSVEDATCLGIRITDENIARLADGISWQGTQRVKGVMQMDQA